jgi:hypothetical protein
MDPAEVNHDFVNLADVASVGSASVMADVPEMIEQIPQVPEVIVNPAAMPQVPFPGDSVFPGMIPQQPTLVPV